MEDEIGRCLDRIVEETGFSGVVCVTEGTRVLLERAGGYADRAHAIPNTMETVFAIASGTKALTALAAMSLVADGALDLDEEVRPRLSEAAHTGAADAAGLLGPGISLRHLLAHTAGLGDYLDEGEIADIEEPILPLPVHRLDAPSAFLPLLVGHPTKFPPGAGFSYCNSGYVILALLIEAVGGRGYHDFVSERVCAPAGLCSTAFLRLDDLPGNAAIGYLPKRGWRTNHLHLPVRGGGDGGAYSTVGDVSRLWEAFFAGRIVPLALVAEMLRPQHDAAPNTDGYGLGFWLAGNRGVVYLEGCDPGISFRSAFAPGTGRACTVLSNTTSGAWPIARELEALVHGRGAPRNFD